MRDTYIFEIPIYRCSKEKFYSDLKKAVEKQHNKIFETTGIPKEKAPQSYKNSEEHTRVAFGGPWNYNQVIGWLKLFAEPSQIGGHLWWVDAKRMRRIMPKKRFYLTTYSDVLSNHFTEDDDSKTIYQRLANNIGSLSNQSPLKGRHVDLEAFLNIGPHIDWRGLLDSAR